MIFLLIIFLVRIWIWPLLKLWRKRFFESTSCRVFTLNFVLGQNRIDLVFRICVSDNWITNFWKHFTFVDINVTTFILWFDRVEYRRAKTNVRQAYYSWCLEHDGVKKGNSLTITPSGKCVSGLTGLRGKWSIISGVSPWGSLSRTSASGFFGVIIYCLIILLP